MKVNGPKKILKEETINKTFTLKAEALIGGGNGTFRPRGVEE